MAGGYRRRLGRRLRVQGAGAGEVTPAVIQLTIADLLALLGLPAIALALLRLAQAAKPDATVSLDSISRGFGSGQLTDGCLLALSAFSVGWIAILRHATQRPTSARAHSPSR